MFFGFVFEVFSGEGFEHVFQGKVLTSCCMGLRFTKKKSLSKWPQMVF